MGSGKGENEMDARESLKEAKRIVVKVGTSTLAYGPGRMNLYNIEHLVRGLVDMANEGREMILVSSGAIAAGLGRLGMTEKPDSIPEKQAIAAVGQGMLMHIYEKFFAEYGKTAAQVLLTRENSVRHNQYIHSREALCAMLEMGAIPVINENDAVTVDEIKIGDNDQLSATVATLVDADALIILSDIDGLYTANPATHPDAQIIHEVPEITPEIERLAGGAGTTMGTGGMMTKIEAAKVAMNAGVTMVIAPGARDHVLRDAVPCEGEPSAPAQELDCIRQAHRGRPRRRPRLRKGHAAVRLEPARGRHRLGRWRVHARQHRPRPDEGRAGNRARRRELWPGRAHGTHRPADKGFPGSAAASRGFPRRGHPPGQHGLDGLIGRIGVV